VAFEIEAAGTRFAADAESRSALALLFDGDEWMIYRNTITGVLHWDFVSISNIQFGSYSIRSSLLLDVLSAFLLLILSMFDFILSYWINMTSLP
jgi:hypothetical protein